MVVCRRRGRRPLTLRDALACGEGFQDNLCPLSLLRCGLDGAGEEISVQVLIIMEVDGKLVVAVPASAWHKKIVRRTVPRTFLSKVAAALVASCAADDRNTIVEGARMWGSRPRERRLLGNHRRGSFHKLWVLAFRRPCLAFCAGGHRCRSRAILFCKRRRCWPTARRCCSERSSCQVGAEHCCPHCQSRSICSPCRGSPAKSKASCKGPFTRGAVGNLSCSCRPDSSCRCRLPRPRPFCGASRFGRRDQQWCAAGDVEARRVNSFEAHETRACHHPSPPRPVLKRTRTTHRIALIQGEVDMSQSPPPPFRFQAYYNLLMPRQRKEGKAAQATLFGTPSSL